MSTKKQISNFHLNKLLKLGANNYLLKLQLSQGDFPYIHPGQFVEVAAFGQGVLLRRPISVCNVIPEKRELWLLVARIGRGTEIITSIPEGGVVNIVYPLGNGFNYRGVQRPLLVGGGVGIAPLLYLARIFHTEGIRPDILLGGRTAEHIVLQEEFADYGNLHLSTDDGSLGIHGRVTDHPILEDSFDHVFSCGPKPMMMAVARWAEAHQIACQVSLENTMACGIGACLCCVEDTHERGNVCVCTEGPVFNSLELKWQN